MKGGVGDKERQRNRQEKRDKERKREGAREEERERDSQTVYPNAKLPCLCEGRPGSCSSALPAWLPMALVRSAAQLWSPVSRGLGLIHQPRVAWDSDPGEHSTAERRPPPHTHAHTLRSAPLSRRLHGEPGTAICPTVLPFLFVSFLSGPSWRSR